MWSVSSSIIGLNVVVVLLFSSPDTWDTRKKSPEVEGRKDSLPLPRVPPPTEEAKILGQLSFELFVFC